MDPDQTVRMRRLVWIHAGRKPIMLVLSWHGSNIETELTTNSIEFEFRLHGCAGWPNFTLVTKTNHFLFQQVKG
jgi:hypothetical protein